MDINKQSQSAGDNSTQMLAQQITNNVYVGVTEQRAREICREEYALTAHIRAEEAKTIADARVSKLEDRVIPKIMEHDYTLKPFSDPSFLLSLKQAQISAASSEREDDYDLLAELLVSRVKGGEDRGKRLAINKAIEVVDKIPEDALIGLGMVYAVTNLYPLDEDFRNRLERFNSLYGCIIGSGSLPNGTEWLEHLDLLSVIRLSPKGIGSFNKMEEFIPEAFRAQRVQGFTYDDPILLQIKKDFSKLHLPLTCFVPHPLKPGYEMLSLPNDINEIKLYFRAQDQTIQLPLSNEQKDLLQKALGCVNKDASHVEDLKKEILKQWNTFPILNQVLQWWNSLPVFFNITPAGNALANAFIHGKDPNVPKIK